MTKPNKEQLSNNTYVVRSMAGFKRALGEYARHDKDDTSIAAGLPESFPAFVEFHRGARIYAYCTPLKVKIAELEALLANLKAY